MPLQATDQEMSFPFSSQAGVFRLKQPPWIVKLTYLSATTFKN